MSPKIFVGLLVITVITSAAAVVTAYRQPAATPVRYGDQPAFPALRANPDAVAKIVLTTPEGSFSLVRETGDRWSSAERFGYTVDSKRVRDLVVALADMRLIEAKTKMPDRYGRIQVEDVKAKDAKSRLLRLESADGKVLAEALIGKEHHRLTGTEPEGTYLRRPGEAQAWLASGGIRIEPKVVDWLDKQVVDLGADSVRRVEIRPDGSPAYVVTRPAEGGALAFEGLAQGEKPKKDANLDRLAGAFAGVTFDDVKPRTQLSWPSAHQTAIATTFGGVELTVQLAKIDDQPWAIFDAREVAAATPANGAAPAAGDQAAAAPATKDAAGKTTGTAAGAAAGTAAAAADEAAGTTAAKTSAATGKDEPNKLTAGEINERVANWAYKIPSYIFDRLTKPRTEWLEHAETS